MSSEKEKEKEKETEKFEEWYFLQGLYQNWKQGNPENHELYKKSAKMVPPGQSLVYYQGMYHCLTTLFPVIETVLDKNNELFKENPEIVMEVMKLQIGHIIHHMLEKWPAKDIPTVSNTKFIRGSQ